MKKIEKILKFIILFNLLFLVSSCIIKEDSSNKFTNNHIVDIAVLLPFSQDAQSTKELAQMIKLGLMESTQMKIRLSTYDSTAQHLDTSLKQIIDNNIQIIIGPDNSDVTKTIARTIKNKDITLFSMSNNPSLADKQILICGHAPMHELQYLINYFLQKQYKHYIALLPTGRESDAISQILENLIALKSNNSNINVEFYDNNEKNLNQLIKKISSYVDDVNEDDLTFYKPIILLNDDPKSIHKIYKYIIKYNLDKKALIVGNSQINIDHFISPVDIVFSGSNQMKNPLILSQIAKENINHISYLHAISYDIGNIIGRLLTTDYKQSVFLEKLHSSQFKLMSGNIKFIDSIAKRSYFLIAKYNGQYIDYNQLIQTDLKIDKTNKNSTDASVISSTTTNSTIQNTEAK